MKCMLRGTTLCFLLLGILLGGCRPDLPAEIATVYEQLPEQVDFNYHVKPILSDRCYACHGPDNNTRAAGLRLDTEEGAYAALESGHKAIVPGSWANSHLLERILSTDPETVMPPPESNLSLTAEEVAIIAKWIDQGAEYKKHWSFIPPQQAAVPDPAAGQQLPETFLQNPIDHFVAAKLAENEMMPSQRSDKERLLRRVTLDLTGLPPTVAEMDAFLADNSPEAYEKVVDRLLASEAYGERLAMEWMDVARYADSHGMHADGARTMWPWRDWVIKAFNQNMPYDQFVTWQLAGDLLPNATREQKLATGFHRNHPMTAEGGAVDEEFRLKYVFDRANTTATAFLGLTLECAQCHDHKFDPLSQKEYYQMAAFFNNVRELGMTGDDGDYGPMLMLPTDEQKQAVDSLNRLADRLLGELDGMGKDTEQLKGFVSQLPEAQPVKLPKPAGYFPVEQISEATGAKGKKLTIIDGSHKTDIKSEPQLVAGIKGQALHFDDGYEALHLHEIGNFELTEPFSASVWIKPDGDKKIQAIMGTSGHKNNFWRGWDFYLDSANHLSLKLINCLPHNMIHIQSGEQVPVGEWTQVGFTYDGAGRADGLRLYLNGKAVKKHTIYDRLYKSIRTVKGGNHMPINRPIRLGSAYRAFTGENGIYKGAVDEIHVFHNQLTQAEMAQLHAQTLGESIPISSLTERAKRELALQRLHPEFASKRSELKAILDERLAIVNEIEEVMVMEETPKPRPMYVFARGAYDAPTEQVRPNTPQAVGNFPESEQPTRLGLAKWIFSRDNPLAARVAVNRYWQLIFGRGLVDSPHDFGFQGSLPSHPKLLDWLAVEFMESGWDLKKLLKLMVMSGTYQQASVKSEQQVKQDPANVWLARGPSKRLPAEMIRDNALAASGLLAKHVGGVSVKPYQPEGLWIEKGNFSHELLHYRPDEGDSLYRRSLYTFVRRTSPHPAMVAFDAPNRDVCTMKRESTNTPLQALVLLNDPQFVEAARVMAQRLQKEGGETVAEKVTTGFRLATGRKPNPQEVAVLTELLEDARQRFAQQPEAAADLLAVGEYPTDPQLDHAETAAWAVVSSTLLNHDEAYTKR